MAQVVIADAGPLIAFAGIDKLTILRTLFSIVFLTESVKNECFAKPGEDASRIETSISDGWLIVLPSQTRPSLSPSLGAGESDSIQLASNNPEETLLIIDDRLARRYALQKGLHIVGTVRLLDLAEQNGLIDSAERCIQDMVAFGYRISLDLLAKIRSEN